MRFSRLTTLFAAAVLFVAPTAAQAQFTVFTNFSDFLAATSNLGTDSFDDISVDAPASPLARQAGSHSYAVATNTLGFYNVGNGADRWLSSDESFATITFSGFDALVRGLGGFFFGTTAAGDINQQLGLTVTATSASGAVSETFIGAPGSFLGFVSTDAILSLTVKTEIATVDMWPTVNDFVVANAATTVPEPSSFVLLAIGIAGVLVVMKRRAA